MNCKEARRYINLFIDSELDSKTSFEISEHLSSCEDCSKRFAQEERIEKSFVSILKEGKDPKSEEIWRRVISGFSHPVDSQEGRHSGFWTCLPERLWRAGKKRYLIPATVASLAIIITLILYSKQEHNDLTFAIHDCHMEYVTNKITPSVESVYPGVVAKYFSGKFTFPVILSEIPDIKSHHIRLFGGKVCHLNGISTAYIMYHCCNTPVSVFILGTKDIETFSDMKQYLKGDEILFERKDGIRFAAKPINQDSFVCVIGDHDLELIRWMAENFVNT